MQDALEHLVTKRNSPPMIVASTLNNSINRRVTTYGVRHDEGLGPFGKLKTEVTRTRDDDDRRHTSCSVHRKDIV